LNGDEVKKVTEHFDRLFAPMDESIRKFQEAFGIVGKDVAVIKTKQETQGREIGEIKKRVSKLDEKVSMMPDRWRSDMRDHVVDQHGEDTRNVRIPVAGAAEIAENSGIKITKVDLFALLKVVVYIIAASGSVTGVWKVAEYLSGGQ
jgi:hypothetical protein